MRAIVRQGRIAAALVSCLVGASLAMADGQPAFESVTLKTPAPGVRDHGADVVTTVNVQADGSVKLELCAGAKVLGTTTGKATKDELGRIARALAATKASTGSAGYCLTWRQGGKDAAASAAVAAVEPGDGPLSGAVGALRAVQARIVWGESGSSPLSPRACTVEGTVEVTGKLKNEVVIRDPKNGAVAVKDTNQSSALAFYLSKQAGKWARVYGTLRKTAGGAVLEIEAADGAVRGKPELFLFAKPDGWPYSFDVAAGTPALVRASVADADGNDYDWVELSGGLQGYILRKHVNKVVTPTPGLSGAVKSSP